VELAHDQRPRHGSPRARDDDIRGRRERLFVKLNSAFGISSKAAGWAPEVGVVFRF
jgi:hypothetical protein